MNDRRDFFRSAARTELALGLAAAGQPLIALPSPVDAPVDDIGLMNTALALEHEAIWVYGLAGRSGAASWEGTLSRASASWRIERSEGSGPVTWRADPSSLRSSG